MAKRANGEGSITVQIRNGKKYYTASLTVEMANGEQKRKSKSSYKRSEVVEWKNKLKNSKVEIGSFSKLSDYLKDYLYTVKKPAIKDSSFIRYETTYRLHILPYPISKMTISEIDTSNLQAYFNEVQTNKSTNIAHSCYILLNTVFTRLLDEGAINKNPLKNVIIKSHKAKKSQAFTVEEQNRILNYLTDSIEDTAILLYFFSGIRLSELLGLKKEDFKKYEIRISRQYVRTDYMDADGTRINGTGTDTLKTDAAKRIIPIPKTIYDKIDLSKDGFVFSDTGEKPIDRKRIQRRFKKIQKDLRIEYRSIHKTRHTYITRLIEEGVAPSIVQNLAGHSTINPTLTIYTHVSEQKKKEAIESLNRFLIN